MTSTGEPTVSVVIPIYNGMPFIILAIESVRRQTYPHWELVLCENVSKDDTTPTLERYLAENPDKRIRLIRHEEHLSMGQNWNRSIAYARGQFIKLLPSDDILMPNCLETQTRLLEEHGDIGFVSSGREVIDASGKKYLKRITLKEGKYNWASLGKRLIYAVTNLIGEPGGVMFRRELLKTCGPFDFNYKYFIDIEMYLRFLKETDFYYSEHPLFQFRTHRKSQSASSRHISLQEYMQLLEVYNEELNLAFRPLLKGYLKGKGYMIALLRTLVIQIKKAS